jgi:hypothetical protein
MQLLEEYCLTQGIDQRTAYRWVSQGKINSVIIDKRKYILTSDDIHRMEHDQKQQVVLIPGIKKELNSLILKAASKPEIKVNIINEIESIVSSWLTKGIKLIGYDKKSLYRKIAAASLSGASAVERKTRSDKFAIKNPVIANNIDRILPLAAALYFQNAQPNISQLVKYIQYYATLNEDFYEFASPKLTATLKRQINNHFSQSGFKKLHQYWNHHNTFRETLPTVVGAFTDNIQFGDYYIGDDHKADIAKVFVLDELTGKIIEKEVQTWTWIEGRTMKVLAHVSKVGDFNADDMIMLLVQVIVKYGLPRIGFLIDNGIAKAQKVQNFFARLNHPRAFLIPVEAYTPTAKATVERTFRFYKQEFDAYFNNFVGPDKRKESRHSGRLLSPEKTEVSDKTYIDGLSNYLDGYYAKVKRIRIINGKRREISIDDYFNEEWANFDVANVDDQKLRYAIAEEVIKTFDGKMVVKGETFISPDDMPIAFLGLKYRVLINPWDLSEIDLYALDDMLDRHTGEIVERNGFVAALLNIRALPASRMDVRRIKKDIVKNVKKIADGVVALTADAQKFSPTEQTPSGEVIDQRKIWKKRAQQAIAAHIDKLQPLKEIELTSDFEPRTPETDLTPDDFEIPALEEDNSLTFDVLS